MGHSVSHTIYKAIENQYLTLQFCNSGQEEYEVNIIVVAFMSLSIYDTDTQHGVNYLNFVENSIPFLFSGQCCSYILCYRYSRFARKCYLRGKSHNIFRLIYKFCMLM